MNIENLIQEEYKSAVQLTYHIDELRNKLSTLFLTFSSIVSGVIFLYSKDEIITQSFEKEIILFAICFFIATIGFICICILGRLRRVQFEHFAIINNIRTTALNNCSDKDERSLWSKALVLNSETLPCKESIKSGSYFWLLIILVTSSVIIGIGTLVATNYIIALIVIVNYAYFCNYIYMRLSDYS